MDVGLNIGKYIRTRDGYIGKIVDLVTKQDIGFGNDDNLMELKEVVTKVVTNTGFFNYFEKDRYDVDDIMLCKYDIIDLIMVGDIVNGMPVVAIDKKYHNGHDEKVLYLGSPSTKLRLSMVYNDMIKQVVCKEYVERGVFYCEN